MGPPPCHLTEDPGKGGQLGAAAQSPISKPWPAARAGPLSVLEKPRVRSSFYILKHLCNQLHNILDFASWTTKPGLFTNGSSLAAFPPHVVFGCSDPRVRLRQTPVTISEGSAFLENERSDVTQRAGGHRCRRGDSRPLLGRAGAFGLFLPGICNYVSKPLQCMQTY